jgi:hypothetical protein
VLLQARNYQYALRRRTPELILQAQLELLHVIACLEQKRGSAYTYTRCILLFRLQLEYYRVQRPELYRFLVENLASLNEEEGEIALSVLASVTSTNKLRTHAELLSEHFELMHRMRENTADLRRDVLPYEPQRRRQALRPPSSESRRLVTHLRSVITAIRRNRWNHPVFPASKKIIPGKPVEALLVLAGFRRRSLKIVSQLESIFIFKQCELQKMAFFAPFFP